MRDPNDSSFTPRRSPGRVGRSASDGKGPGWQRGHHQVSRAYGAPGAVAEGHRRPAPAARPLRPAVDPVRPAAPGVAGGHLPGVLERVLEHPARQAAPARGRSTSRDRRPGGVAAQEAGLDRPQVADAGEVASGPAAPPPAAGRGRRAAGDGARLVPVRPEQVRAEMADDARPRPRCAPARAPASAARTRSGRRWRAPGGPRRRSERRQRLARPDDLPGAVHLEVRVQGQPRREAGQHVLAAGVEGGDQARRTGRPWRGWGTRKSERTHGAPDQLRRASGWPPSTRCRLRARPDGAPTGGPRPGVASW